MCVCAVCAMCFGSWLPVETTSLEAGPPTPLLVYLPACCRHNPGPPSSQLLPAAGSPLTLPLLNKQYVDFASWQHQQADGPGWENHLAYWTSKLAGMPALNVMPTDMPTPSGPPGAFAQYKIRVPALLGKRVKEAARKLGWVGWEGGWGRSWCVCGVWLGRGGGGHARWGGWMGGYGAHFW